jgi:hypothetical protein
MFSGKNGPLPFPMAVTIAIALIVCWGTAIKEPGKEPTTDLEIMARSFAMTSEGG